MKKQTKKEERIFEEVCASIVVMLLCFFAALGLWGSGWLVYHLVTTLDELQTKIEAQQLVIEQKDSTIHYLKTESACANEFKDADAQYLCMENHYYSND